MVLPDALERGTDDLGLGAHGEAVHAVVAGAALVGRDPDHGLAPEQRVEGALRAQVTTPAPRCDQQVVEEDATDDAPGQAEAEDQPAVEHRHRVHPLPRQRTGRCRDHQHEAEQPVARVGRGRLAALEPEPTAQPGRRVGDDVHRAHPRAEQAPAQEQIEGQHDTAADQRFLIRPLPRGELLRNQEGVGERQHAERETRRQVALDDPPPQPGADEEQRQDAQLRSPPQQQPLVRPQPALDLHRLMARPRHHAAHRCAADAVGRNLALRHAAGRRLRAHGFHPESRPPMPGWAGLYSGTCAGTCGPSPGLTRVSP